MKFIYLCSILISHVLNALTREISSGTFKDKFHISARPCILYLMQVKIMQKNSCSQGCQKVPATSDITSYFQVFTG